MEDEDRNETASVARACEILSLLERTPSTMRLSEIARSTGINKATAYRILCTLVRHGMVHRSTSAGYTSAISRTNSVPLRIGYASQTSEFSFSQRVTSSIMASAKRAGIEIVSVDNAYNPVIAMQNADTLIRKNVALVIEFQTYASVAAMISAKLHKKHIPMIALEIPHPNAVYFGANNAQAGLTAGRHLGRWAVDVWHGEVDQVLLLGLPAAGALPQSRLMGTLLGLRELMPTLDDGRIQELNGNGRYADSQELVATFLRKDRSRRILVSAVNDPSALGALQAFRDAGRESHCAIVGQNASEEAVVEMRKASTRLIGSVGYFPERYGDQVIALALDIIANKTVPHTNFIKHQLITPGNVGVFYPARKKTK